MNSFQATSSEQPRSKTCGNEKYHVRVGSVPCFSILHSRQARLHEGFTCIPCLTPHGFESQWITSPHLIDGPLQSTMLATHGPNHAEPPDSDIGTLSTTQEGSSMNSLPLPEVCWELIISVRRPWNLMQPLVHSERK